MTASRPVWTRTDVALPYGRLLAGDGVVVADCPSGHVFFCPQTGAERGSHPLQPRESAMAAVVTGVGGGGEGRGFALPYVVSASSPAEASVTGLNLRRRLRTMARGSAASEPTAARSRILFVGRDGREERGGWSGLGSLQVVVPDTASHQTADEGVLAVVRRAEQDVVLRISPTGEEQTLGTFAPSYRKTLAAVRPGALLGFASGLMGGDPDGLYLVEPGVPEPPRLLHRDFADRLAVFDEVVVAGLRRRNRAIEEPRIRAIKWSTGEVLWRSRASTAALCAAAGRVLFEKVSEGRTSVEIEARDPETGAVVWSQCIDNTRGGDIIESHGWVVHRGGGWVDVLDALDGNILGRIRAQLSDQQRPCRIPGTSLLVVSAWKDVSCWDIGAS